jgi:hypothetical protein
MACEPLEDRRQTAGTVLAAPDVRAAGTNF